MRIRTLSWATVALAVAAVGCVGEATPGDEEDLVTSRDIQILSVSDWHGQLDPVSVPNVGNLGGAAVLSSLFKADRAANPYTLTLTAGDSFGATPPLSSFFQDEPAVLAMNLMGFRADTFGNHNFDAGFDHLGQMIDLADFPFVAANLKGINSAVHCKAPAEDACVPPYVIVKIGSVRVAIIGVTNPDAPTLLPPGQLGDVTVSAPAYAANLARADAKKEGAKLVIGLAHMGALGVDANGQPFGPAIDFAKKVHGFDVILADHTNVQFSTTINGALVVENKSQGQGYARIKITVNPQSGSTKNASVEFVTPLGDGVTPDPAIDQLLSSYRADLAKVFDGKTGTTDGIYARGDNVERLSEVPIGDLVADAFRLRYETQLGFTNGGGIRAPLPSSYLPADKTLHRPADGYAAGPPYDLVIGDAYGVLPFGNSLVTRTVTGTQVWAMMEHSVSGLPMPNGFFGQISGFKVAYDTSKPAGQRIVSIKLDDETPIPNDDSAKYSLTTSDFVASGGDGYTMLAGGDGTTRDKAADVLLAYLQAHNTLSPKTDGRLQDVAAK